MAQQSSQSRRRTIQANIGPYLNQDLLSDQQAKSLHSSQAVIIQSVSQSVNQQFPLLPPLGLS